MTEPANLPRPLTPDFSALATVRGLQVIITRPVAQATPWVETLLAHGHEAHSVPLIDIEPVSDVKPIRDAWRRLSQYALVMFVSANAVQHFFNQQPEDADWPLSALAASTGPGTSAALQQAGLRGAMIVEPLHGAGYDSEALWARLSHRNWGGSHVLIVRGEEGRDWLAEQFRAAGAEVTAIAAYRRVAPVHSPETKAVLNNAVAHPAQTCWFFSSSEAIGHLIELVPTADWRSSRALVTHLRIAQAARAAGFGDVHLVDSQPLALVSTIRQIQHMPRLA